MVAHKSCQTEVNAQDLTTCVLQMTVLDLNQVNQEHLRLETGLTTKLSSLPQTESEKMLNFIFSL